MDDYVQVIKQTTVPEILPVTVRKHKSKQKVNDEKLNRRLKKFSSCQTMKMQLSSKFLCVRKKKFKRSRNGKLVSTNLISKSLVDGEGIPADLEPSTSQKYQTTPSGGLDHPQRGQKKFGSKKKGKSCLVNYIVSSINGDSMTNNKVEVVERTAQNGAMLACNNPTERFSVGASAGNPLNARGPYHSKHSSEGSMQNGLMSVLTRGLEETGDNHFVILLQPFVKVWCYIKNFVMDLLPFLFLLKHDDLFFVLSSCTLGRDRIQ